MAQTPFSGGPSRDADGAMGEAPGVEVVDRERIRAGARAKLFGDLPPSGTEDTQTGRGTPRRPSEGEDPERIGRFRILDRLGAGGMGVVYSAYDPELDRRVALKLLRPDLVDEPSRGSRGMSRLQREAQAMARLNHPNVVTVHEVGRHGDQVFVAMEFVAGTTLATWVERRRDWHEVVRIYCDAAAGLGAAHAAGVVHRDFKPENVMLGEDGRVRVMDFGLSRAEGGRATLDEPDPDDRPDNLTKTGAILGTPAYMAPEQHNASRVTPASDQFAFCVSLWEALAGERPFGGQTYGELAGNVVTGRVRSPPSSATAPRRIFEALRKGLCVQPSDRHGSMENLVAALQRRPLGVAGRAGLGLVVLAAGAGTAYAMLRPDPVMVGACSDAGEPIGRAWSPKRRAEVQSALLQTEEPYAAATWSTVERMMDDYAADWARMAKAHCTARMVESSDDVTLGRQEQCLASRRIGFDEVVSVLSSTEEGIAQQAVQAVATLASVQGCANPRGLDAFSTKRAPQTLEALAAAQAQLARARARGGMGHYDEALTLAADVIDIGRRFDDPSTEASGLLVQGQYQERQGDPGAAEQSLREAVRLAEIAEDHTTRALALVRLIYVVGQDAKRHDEARALGADVGAVLRTLGADPLLQAALDTNLGAADRVAGEHDDALEHYRSALDIYLELYGEAHPETGRVLTSLGSLYIADDQDAAAIDVLLRAKKSFETTLGAEHPFVPVVLSNLGTAYKGQGDFDRAIATLEEALQLRRKTDGETHPGVAKTMFNLAAAQYDARRYTVAIATLREGRRILASTDSAEAARLGRYELMIGSCQVNLGRMEEARETLEPLLEVFPTGRSGAFARRTRVFLAIATMPSDMARARMLAEIARESGPADGPQDTIEFLLWLIDSVEPR